MQAQPMRRVLGNHNYRLLLIGQAISQSGGWMARIAQSWLVLEMTDSARVLGPALGGVVVAGLGVAGAFTLNGVSFLAVIVSLLLMRMGPVAAQSSVRDENPLVQIKEALSFAAHEPPIVFTLSALCC